MTMQPEIRNTKLNFLDLPNELIFRILESPSLKKSDHARFARINQRLNAICTEVLYRHLQIECPLDRTEYRKLGEAYLRNDSAPHVREVTINTCTYFNTESTIARIYLSLEDNEHLGKRRKIIRPRERELSYYPIIFMTFHNLIPLVLGFQNLRKLEICDDLGNLGFADTLDIVAYSLERNGNLKELDITQKFGANVGNYVGAKQMMMVRKKQGWNVVARLRRLRIRFIRYCTEFIRERYNTKHWMESWIAVMQGATSSLEEFVIEEIHTYDVECQYRLNPDTIPMPGAEDDGTDGVVLWELPCVKLLEMKVCAFGGLPLQMSYLDVNTLNNVKEFRLNIKAEFTPDDLRKIAINLSCLENLEILEFEHCGVVRRAPAMVWKSRNDVIGSASGRAQMEEKEKEVYKHAAKLCALYITLLKKIIWKSVRYVDKSVWQFESYVIRQSERGRHLIKSGSPIVKIPVKLASLTSPPAFQVITLGAGGGPSEEGVTGFLVRSTATDWSPGSILAVDAGSHLASIIRILENTSSPQHPTTPTTPNSTRRRVSSIQHRDLTVNTNASNPPSHFQGCDLPFKTPRANAAHIFRELVGGYCITHPHLDHISGLVINTAGMLPHNAKKTIAALPPTIEALKLHVFNDIIWPNLSDENGGVGFLTYQRLVDASVVDGKIEYRKVVDGLSVQAWPVSHGHCMHKHTHRGSDAAMVATEDGGPQKCVFKPSTLRSATWQKKCVYDSSCFFIRDDYTSKEIMIFGDVEPDSVSISEPRRNVYIWNYAAEKVHSGVLEAIFIESSYDIHQKDEFLYGHLTPRHIVEELQVLASKVLLQKEREARRYSVPKRRRTNNGYAERSQSLLQIDPFDAEFLQPLSQYNSDGESDVPRSPTDVEGLTTASNIGIQRRSSGGKRRREDDDDDQPEYTSVPTQNVSPISMVSNAGGPVDTALPLKGLKIVIIHIKDDFDDDKDVRQSILANLKRLGEKAGLGCEFELAETGGSMFF
ncbi:hypothetical protein AOL_s00097g378 [Orbilia oligospora ATCC 24927]|uniref:3',5'-cyclic-nucleotide phosphodiesterase pde1 n=1 Tax=Arthrobotrys oligospora (strain ATCC 24927 / CBS 115.81 / DSM 1491) TaxID=756982 RepID=G1XJ51_ARTOA|nr:hypothetical protein AOL_s00097g378 [Orbilia oligospora ATCC 24927]EGX46952.1 hypothetical protein AOL_s00097g378 [Orbilia oligospora ATCC 24927]